jgi:hypothetical protein
VPAPGGGSFFGRLFGGSSGAAPAPAAAAIAIAAPVVGLHPLYGAAALAAAATAKSEAASLTSLKSVEIYNLYGRALQAHGALAAAAGAAGPAAAGGAAAEVSALLDRLYNHVCAESAADRLSVAAGVHTWAHSWGGGRVRRGGFGFGFGGGGGGGGGDGGGADSWTPFSDSDNMTIESERRRGQPRATLTLVPGGERVVVDFATMQLLDRASGGAMARVAARAAGCGDGGAGGGAAVATMDADDEACALCCEDFGDDVDEVERFTSTRCGHSPMCTECWARHVATLITEDGGEAVSGWVRCQAIGCECELPVADIVAATTQHPTLLPPATLALLPLTFLRKLVVRNPEWVPCANAGGGSGFFGGAASAAPCLYGFLVTVRNENKRVKCPLCAKAQKVVRVADAPDPALEAMVADGTMRPCPKCRFLTLKEFGVCNVIQCQRCAIWWNWAHPDETGRSSKELKDRARRSGSLWGAGELSFQQTLQQTDPAAFKALLERNGIAFDPNYRRGT